jgi:hypothetical protein
MVLSIPTVGKEDPSFFRHHHKLVTGIASKSCKDGCPIKEVGHDTFSLSSPQLISGDLEDVSERKPG